MCIHICCPVWTTVCRAPMIMQAALNAMQEAGVERVFLTPHVMADLPDNRRSYLQDRFACMKQFAPEGSS